VAHNFWSRPFLAENGTEADWKQFFAAG